ncbi:hypothetical protein GCM10011517_20370 [Actibacterium pelagium]|uniref:THIF-type NAD/FAD binding fold domain-containing protein n=2 Tax=Actibacterium pelagium TaxID=2029103 RepID=A0A917EJV0_9RHOB|nr:hypothetical protein GCM10011517_20370 [Actibacterium pelagium]
MGEGNEMSRYARQMILPEVGPEGQEKLSKARVKVVGAGGLGSPVIQYLAGAGIGTLSVSDPDRVAVTNLHRQVIYTEDRTELYKAQAAAEYAQRLNGDVSAIWSPDAVTPNNAVDIANHFDIVVDCADSYAASYILSDACLETNTPLISASVLQMTGYVGGFCAGAPSLRAVFPELPDHAASCATAGVLGPVVGIIGSIQAQMTLAHILGLDPSPLGQFVHFDAQTMRSSSFRFDGAPEPQAGHRFISARKITSDDLVVDLRDSEEAPRKATADAVRTTIDKIETLPNTDRRTVICCASGLRAWRAADRLKPYWRGEIVLAALGPT